MTSIGRLLVLALFLGSLPILTITKAQSSINDCGGDSVLVWPITRSGPLPQSEVVAYDLDGRERARFQIERPEQSAFTSAKGRALVLHYDDVATIIDVTTGTSYPVEDVTERGFASLDARNYINSLPPGSHFVLVDGRELFPSLINLESGYQPFQDPHLSDLQIWGLIVSDKDEYLAVMVDRDLYLGDASGQSSLRAIEVDSLYSTPVFDPATGNLVYFLSDYTSSESTLMLIDSKTFERRPIGTAPNGVRSLISVGQYQIAYGLPGAVVVTRLDTGASSTYHLDQEWEGHIEAQSSDSLSLYLESEIDSSGTLQTIQHNLLDLETGETNHLVALDGFRLSTVAKGVSWLTFSRFVESSQTYDHVIVDSNTGKVLLEIPATVDARTFEFVEEADDNSSSVYEVVQNDMHTVSLIDHETAQEINLKELNGKVHATYSPDGCYVAIGDYLPTPELRTANITIYELDGTAVSTLNDAILIGWAPAG